MIEQLRQKSGARITVSELIPGVHERILSIAGPLEAVVRAYDEVLGKILEKRRSTEYEEVSTGGGGGEHQQQGDVSTMVIKVLLPHIRMGNIIGKHGCKIWDSCWG